MAGSLLFLLLLNELREACGETCGIRFHALIWWCIASTVLLAILLRVAAMRGWTWQITNRRAMVPFGLLLLALFLVEQGREGRMASMIAVILWGSVMSLDEPRGVSEELHRARLIALRAQLQPHFLFNTLHAIGVTAKHDPDAAQRMTTLLGDLLRAALVDRGGKLVTIGEELTLLQPYLQLQQVRFQDRLRIETDVPVRLFFAKVPDLLLQPLVENAIEHGIEQRPGAGLVRIAARAEDGKLVVEVEDDGPGPEHEGEPKDVGTGLGATIKRIRLLFAAEAWLELRRNRHGGTTTQVRLPLEFVKAVEP